VIAHNPVSIGAFIWGWMSGMRASELARAGTHCPGDATWPAQIAPTRWGRCRACQALRRLADRARAGSDDGSCAVHNS